jgi:hypothetical protein
MIDLGSFVFVLVAVLVGVGSQWSPRMLVARFAPNSLPGWLLVVQEGA